MAAPAQTNVMAHSHRSRCSVFFNYSFLFHVFLSACCLQSISGVDMSFILPPLCKHRDVEAKINSAVLTVQNGNEYDAEHENVVVFMQSQQCYKCDLLPVARVNSSCDIRVDSRWKTRLEIRLLRNDKLAAATNQCSEANLSQLFVEKGKYKIFIEGQQDDEITCNLVTMTNPPEPNIPIYVAMGILVFLAILWNCGKYFYKRGYIHRTFCFWSTESMMADLGSPTNINPVDDGTPSSESIAPPSTKERLKSLDTFRGISIVIMIFVNYGGGKYWFFKHSKWNGITVADLVFPWFVFIMGTAMALSFQSQIRRNVPRWKMFYKIVKRSATLFLLGLLINSFGVRNGVEFNSFRIPGVLQRFAGTYLITATVFLFLSPQHFPNHVSKFPGIRDITRFWPEWLVNIAFVAVHLSITMAMPVPGCPRGYLGPGGLEQHGKYFNCVGGASGYIDRMFFGESHIYSSPTSKEIYASSLPYDPEGLLGTLNSCVLCFLGLQAGKILFVYTDWVQRTRRFFIWAIVLGGTGILLCEGSLNEGWIPINKNLWSLSYILVMSGMSFFLLMICYILIDVYKIWSGAPFSFAGMNAIALYCGHEFFSGRAPVYFAVPDTHAALLAINLWGTAFWVLVSVYFFYNNIFLSV
ncbi:heparan-alpha-glucosaminide n-acetyltransferase [Plakobranchus ocellatus]|uniref:Heparan-alpha-glucosaminide n-acetyltransferase n=1 Tax=Plakobranchus ocellatus TaxID=259542 RepID=A0AAV3ZV89_9GAST|nr:heparan-alpha-glucosaminide n-acetyltransferase [Plakobranchus ocellatus]